jgi:hypothetical protein
MALTRLASRETLREALLRCASPFCAVRTKTGSASFSAAAAASLSPEAIASSTYRAQLRMRLRRPLLASVRRMVWRAAFFADLVLAMVQILNVEPLRHWPIPESAEKRGIVSPGL